MLNQSNLRNRVASTQAIDVENSNVPRYRAATFYSYDIHGNIDTFMQDYGNSTVMSSVNQTKKIVYDYDLISGKVNQVRYQPGNASGLPVQAHGFYHQYTYDAENRITGVKTSWDSILWQNDAACKYYRHLISYGRTLPMTKGLCDYKYSSAAWYELD